MMDFEASKLFSERNLVYLATIMEDGSPQVTPVWAGYHDGHILVNTAEGRIKHKNVVRDSRVALSVSSVDDPLKMASVRGVVEDIISDYEYEYADKLAKQYMGRDSYPFKQDNERRITFKIRPISVYVMPPIEPSD